MTGWTDERIETLKRMRGEGASGSEIARALHISRNAALGKVHRLGLSLPLAAPRPKSPPVAKTIRKARAAVLELLPEMIFDPITGTSPRPWIERTARECSWPVGEGLSCCAPVHARGWCAAHHAAGTKPEKARKQNMERLASRYAA